MAGDDEPEMDPALVDAHVRRCTTCQDFRGHLQHREVPAPALSPVGVSAGELATVVRRHAARIDRDRQHRALRYALIVLGVQIILLSARPLFIGDSGSSPHDVRHTAAFATAFGVGLLLVARRPARARTMLSVGQVIVAGLVLSALFDIADQTVTIENELFHLPEVAAVVVLWMLVNLDTAPLRRVGS